MCTTIGLLQPCAQIFTDESSFRSLLYFNKLHHSTFPRKYFYDIFNCSVRFPWDTGSRFKLDIKALTTYRDTISPIPFTNVSNENKFPKKTYAVVVLFMYSEVQIALKKQGPLPDSYSAALVIKTRQ